MGVIFQTGYSLPGSDEPLTHARIAHSGNWHSGGTVTASGTETGYFESGPNTSLTYEKWKPDALTATWEVDLGSALECDYCVIGAHTMGTNGNTLQIQYHNGSGWTGVIPSTALTVDMPIMAIFGSQTRQRWRIQISSGTAPEVGVIKFGKALQMQRALYGGHAPLDLARQTVIRTNKSTTGEFLGRSKIRSMGKSSFSWAHLKADWVRTNWRPLQLAVETEPFFIAWRPITFSEVALCYVDSVPIPENMGVKDYMSVSMQVTQRGYD